MSNARFALFSPSNANTFIFRNAMTTRSHQDEAAATATAEASPSSLISLTCASHFIFNFFVSHMSCCDELYDLATRCVCVFVCAPLTSGHIEMNEKKNRHTENEGNARQTRTASRMHVFNAERQLKRTGKCGCIGLCDLLFHSHFCMSMCSFATTCRCNYVTIFLCAFLALLIPASLFPLF